MTNTAQRYDMTPGEAVAWDRRVAEQRERYITMRQRGYIAYPDAGARAYPDLAALVYLWWIAGTRWPLIESWPATPRDSGRRVVLNAQTPAGRILTVEGERVIAALMARERAAGGALAPDSWAVRSNGVTVRPVRLACVDRIVGELWRILADMTEPQAESEGRGHD